MHHYLTKHAHFASKEALDEATNKHTARHWNDLNQTDRAVLQLIRQYSAKYGSAHLKVETLEKQLGKSDATIRRVIRKLEKLKIMERIPFTRPVSSGLGANIYSILPLHEESEMNTPTNTSNVDGSKQPTKETEKEPLSFNIINKDFKKTYPTEKIPETLYGKMREYLSSTIGDTNLARKFYGIHRHHANKLLKFSIYEDKEPLFEQLAFEALHITIQATKRKQIHNLPGYFSRIYNKKIDDALFKDIHMDYEAPPVFRAY